MAGCGAVEGCGDAEGCEAAHEVGYLAHLPGLGTAGWVVDLGSVAAAAAEVTEKVRTADPGTAADLGSVAVTEEAEAADLGTAAVTEEAEAAGLGTAAVTEEAEAAGLGTAADLGSAAVLLLCWALAETNLSSGSSQGSLRDVATKNLPLLQKTE